VNRENSFRVLEERIEAPPRAQLDSRKTTGPVIAVNNIGLPVELPQQRKRGAPEECEAFMIILETIDRGAREILRRINQVSRSAGHFALEDSDCACAAAPIHGYIFNHFAAQQIAIDLFIQRQNHNCVMAVTAQCLWQSTGHISQAARLGKGHNFR